MRSSPAPAPARFPRPQVNEALDDLAKAGRFSPDQSPLIHQGELLTSVGRTDEAKAVAKRATDAEPDNLQAWFLTWVLADPKSHGQGPRQGPAAPAQPLVRVRTSAPLTRGLLLGLLVGLPGGVGARRPQDALAAARPAR